MQEQDAQIEVTMLRNKEISDAMERDANQQKLEKLLSNKAEI